MNAAGHRTSVKCYIEEYETPLRQRAARLREKGTNRKVDLGMVDDPTAKAMFLKFLSAAGQQAHSGVLPDLLEKDRDEDSILVAGTVDFDSPDEIRFLYDDQLEYSVI